MARKYLSERGVMTMNPPAKGEARLEIWDTNVPAFGLRVSSSGVKSFFLSYRIGGKKCRLTLGSYDSERFTVAMAREAAREAQAALSKGKDPSAPPPPPPEKVEPPSGATVADLVPKYINAVVKPQGGGIGRRDWKEVERALKVDLVAKLGDRDIASIQRADIRDMRDAIIARGAPTHARRVLTMTKAFFAWCAEYDHVASDPAAGIKQVGEETKLTRTLALPELARVWLAAEAMGLPFGPLYQLLAVTGVRRDEAAGARWSEMDLASATWTIPPERMKSGQEHVVPLSPAAVVLLLSLPVFSSDLIFSTTGKTAPSGWSRAKRRLDEQLSRQALPGDRTMAPFVIHDLRRSVASGLQATGAAAAVVQRVLAHSSGPVQGVDATYMRHDYVDERREALGRWGEAVTAAIAEASRKREERAAMVEMAEAAAA